MIVRAISAGHVPRADLLTGSSLATLRARPYIWRGDPAFARRILTAPASQPTGLPPRSQRAERLAAIAGMRFHDSGAGEPLPGYVTAEQAARKIGVSKRTIERYKRELRAGGGS